MDSEDKVLAKVISLQSCSSSAQSTPVRNGRSYDISKGQDLLHEYLKSPKKELLRTCFDKEKKHTASSKGKVIEPLRTNNRGCKKLDSRKGENPLRVSPVTDLSKEVGSSTTWVCKNSACRAILTPEDTFCKRCSCCICHLFDDNKDPSLWLVCTSEFGDEDSCGLSCHIECALQRQKAGVVNHGQLMQLDGSYCCASCGKVSGLLGCWKKQLVIAKDARRVDVLCYRMSLSYRLLDGTSRFKELHEIVGDAKTKLETEVGPVSGVSSKMARGIVSRLSVGNYVQNICSIAIKKADEWLSTISNANPLHREVSLPAACKFLFEEVTSSSLVIVLKEPYSSSSEDIKGFKLWYCNSRDELHSKDPICVFPRDQRRILVSNLQPCTEYTFRIISYTDSGNLGHSEAKCFTKSVEIIHKNSDSTVATDSKNDNSGIEGSSSAKKETKITKGVESSGFRVRDLGKILQIAWAQEDECINGFCSTIKSESIEEDEPACDMRGLDLNVVTVPDLNAELTPPLEFSRDEDDEISNEMEKNGDSHDCVSTLINGSPLQFSSGSGRLDGSYEYCVKTIRWLECGGHIEKEFRMKFLTWFSLRSSEQERRVVNTFIRTLIDDPSSLAGQLVDSFSDIISCKRLRNGFCSKLWH